MASEIIVSINVQSGKAEVNLGKAKKGVDKLAAAEKRLADANADGAIKIAELNLRTKERIQLNNQAAAETLKNVNKTSGQFRTQVGLNNAILTEAGRAASDMRFGFNGVANNVGQLASLFGNLIQTSDNVGKSLFQLGKSLIGTGGILIAVQLIIAYGDRVIEFFTGAATAVDKETEALEKNNEKLRENLEIRSLYSGSLGRLTRSMVDSMKEIFFDNIDNIDLQEQRLIGLSNLMKERAVSGAKVLVDETIALDARLLIAEKLIEAEENKIKQAEQLAKIKESEVALATTQEQIDRPLVNEQFKESYNKRLAVLKTTAKEERKVLNSQIEVLGLYGAEANKIADEIDVLKNRGIVLTPETDNGTGTADSLTQSLDLSRKIQAARADVRKGAAIDDMDAIRIQGENEEKAVETQAEVFLDKQKQRLERKLITQEQYNDSELQAKEELAEAIEAIQDKTDNREINLQGKRNEKANQLNIDASFIRKELMLNEELMEDRILGRRAGKALKFQQERLNTEIRRLKARLEAEELHVEQRAKLQKQLSQAELKESGIRTRIADAEANAKIQSLTLVSSALNVASKIAGENSKAGKALAVSGALVSTYLSAQKAYESQFTPLATVDSPVRATLAAAIAVASGLANVKAILATNPAGQSSAVSRGGASVSAPSFNVVGASATNQLAQTVAGQVNAPLRAYVVGSDISDQQELDRSIISTAGIG